jgi:hypothetical protein
MKEIYATAKFVMFDLPQSFPHFIILPYNAHLIYNLLSSFTFNFLQRSRRRMQGSGFCEGVVNPTLMFKVQMSKCPNLFNTCGVQELYYTSLEFDYTLKLYMKSHALGMRRANFV